MKANKVAGAPAVPGANAAPKVDDRKIIYTARVEVIVPNYDEAAKQVAQLIEDHGGYVAQSEFGGTSGERRRAVWVARVPVEKYEAMLDAVAGIGELQTKKIESEDVTDQFIDVEARLKNKQAEEQRLLEHLKNSTGKLEDILAVEKELSRVRGEIEQAQGRINYLRKATAYTTITLTLYERKDYVPPTAPSYATTLGRTFGDSLDTLMSFFKGLLLVAVALVPWLPLILPPVALLLWKVRQTRRTRRNPPEVIAVEPEPRA